MEREWVKNSQPSGGEIAALSLVVASIIGFFPLVIGFAIFKLDMLGSQAGFCCTTFIAIRAVLIAFSYAAIRDNYKAVTHVGFSQDGITLRHRTTDSIILQWDNIEKLQPTLDQTKSEYYLNYRNPKTGMSVQEIVDTRIADMIREGKARANMPEDRRFCPGCGRQNDGWDLCPNCGRGWD